MIVRGIDSNNDWLFGKGKNDYKKDKNAVAQTITTKLQSFIGDCFFAVEDGIDWFNLMGAKESIALKLSVSARILNIPEVSKIVELSIDRDLSRKITIRYNVDTVYGVIIDTFNNEVV